MRYAVGLMACIAIAFIVITSPEDGRSQAGSQPVDSRLVQSVQAMSDAVARLGDEVHALKLREQAGSAVADEVASLSDKIAEHEARFVSITAKQSESLAQFNCECDCDSLRNRLDALEAKVRALETRTASNATPAPTAANAANAATTAAPPSQVQSGRVGNQPYSPRWTNYDGLPPRDHAILAHGFNPSLSDDELARRHDAYHDRYGPDPPSAARSRIVTRSTGYMNCPGGVCPAGSSRTAQTGGGLLGFGILGRRR